MTIRRRIQMVYFSMFPSMHAVGPASTLAILAKALSENNDVTLFTLNFDYSSRKKLFPKCDVETTSSTGFEIIYVPHTFRRIYEVYKFLRNHPGPLTIHCLYDFRLSIPALLISLVLQPSRTIIHMPHGIFMDVIQRSHRLRKRMFCAFLAWPPIRDRVIHVASSEREMIEVRKRVGPGARVVIISHFFGDVSRFLPKLPREKVAGTLSIGFVGRIAEQKNLIFAIETLSAAGVPAQLHVFGEAADERYFLECQRVARDRGVSGLVLFRGMLPKEDLFREMSKMDLFFSPTLGENFGQAILEALSLGIPVLLSTETPWLDVGSYNAGWALDLAAREEFVTTLRLAFDAGEETWSRYREGARRYAAAKNKNRSMLLAWNELLETVSPSDEDRLVKFG